MPTTDDPHVTLPDVQFFWRQVNNRAAGQPVFPFPWRAAESPLEHEAWYAFDAAGRTIAKGMTRPVAELVARLPDLMGEYEPVRPSIAGADRARDVRRRRELEEDDR